MSAIRLYGSIEKVEEQGDGTLVVHGIASTESRDADGEIVRASAMKAALPDYLKFGAIREMHQPMAAGTALGAEVGVDGVTRLEAHVVDPVACLKVKTGVYKGFSIGGRVRPGGRNKSDPKVIESLSLTEISLVDRPANPDAIFQLVKFDAGQEQTMTESTTVTDAPVQGETTSTVPAAVIQAAAEVIAENPPEVAKAGRRFSAQTKAALKAAHDMARACDKALTELGYEDEEEQEEEEEDEEEKGHAEPDGDEGKPTAPGSDELPASPALVLMADAPKGEEAITKAAAISDELTKAQEVAKALTAERDDLKKRLADAETRLAAKGALRAMPVEKAQDAGVAAPASEPEPTDSLGLIRKAHRSPIHVLSRG